jgi:hypothetical protein
MVIPNSRIIKIILWRICPKKELLSHGNIETRTQPQNYECYSLLLGDGKRANKITQ